FDQIPQLLVEAVTDALNSAELTIEVTGDVNTDVLVPVPLGSLQVNIAGTLGGFVGAEGSEPPTTDLDGTEILGLELGQLLTPITDVVTDVFLPALVQPISGAITDEGTWDSIFRPAVDRVR